MKKIKFLIYFFFLLLPFQILKSEIIIMSACSDKQDEFLKNEYILDLNELIMTRNYIYKEKTSLLPSPPQAPIVFVFFVFCCRTVCHCAPSVVGCGLEPRTSPNYEQIIRKSIHPHQIITSSFRTRQKSAAKPSPNHQKSLENHHEIMTKS